MFLAHSLYARRAGGEQLQRRRGSGNVTHSGGRPSIGVVPQCSCDLVLLRGALCELHKILQFLSKTGPGRGPGGESERRGAGSCCSAQGSLKYSSVVRKVVFSTEKGSEQKHFSTSTRGVGDRHGDLSRLRLARAAGYFYRVSLFYVNDIGSTGSRGRTRGIPCVYPPP